MLVLIAEEKDLFLNKFVQCLRTEVSETSEGFKSSSHPQKAAIVSKNLGKHLYLVECLPVLSHVLYHYLCLVGSLLSHAESLIPTFLNEEDVQLLR